MKKLIIFCMVVALMFCVINTNDAMADSGWSSSWEENGYTLAAYAETTKSSVIRKKDVPETKVYHDGKTQTTLKSEGIKFDVKADKTLGVEYRGRFKEIYPKINTGLMISVKMDTASFKLDKETKKGYWKIIVETKGYTVTEKVQQWAQSVIRLRPEGITIYKKVTKYAPAKNNSAYKIVECD